MQYEEASAHHLYSSYRYTPNYGWQFFWSAHAADMVWLACTKSFLQYGHMKWNGAALLLLFWSSECTKKKRIQIKKTANRNSALLAVPHLYTTQNIIWETINNISQCGLPAGIVHNERRSVYFIYICLRNSHRGPVWVSVFTRSTLPHICLINVNLLGENLIRPLSSIRYKKVIV